MEIKSAEGHVHQTRRPSRVQTVDFRLGRGASLMLGSASVQMPGCVLRGEQEAVEARERVEQKGGKDGPAKDGGGVAEDKKGKALTRRVVGRYRKTAKGKRARRTETARRRAKY